MNECKEMNTGTRNALIAEPQTYVHMTWHTLPTSDTSLGLLTLSAPVAGDLMELLMPWL